jgi:hypothetical protein
MTTLAKINLLPPQWTLLVHRDDEESWLTLHGPDGQGASFSCDHKSVRALVLQNLVNDFTDPLSPDNAANPEAKS